MTFSYLETLTASKDKIRLHIGDTVEDSGPRPDRRNFSDEELTYIVSEETTVNASVARCFEILANEWAAYAVMEREGEVTFDAKTTAAEFRTQAAYWRKKPGGAAEAERSAGIIDLTRYDAWTEAAESEYV